MLLRTVDYNPFDWCSCSFYSARYFAVGSADSLVSLWDISEMLCVRTFTKLEWVSPWIFCAWIYFNFQMCKFTMVFQKVYVGFCYLYYHADNNFVLLALRWPVRTISFNHTGEYIASASEDLFIDIVCICWNSLYWKFCLCEMFRRLSFLDATLYNMIDFFATTVASLKVNDNFWHSMSRQTNYYYSFLK